MVVAGFGRPGRGLLALTDRRLLFVSERVVRRPRIVSIESEAITSMRVDEEFRYGTIHVDTTTENLHFRGVRNEEARDFVGQWFKG